ncbi:T9SS type A sorting domain-containing protein [Sediminibacter sp. Hel_I_10]|uniref:T9SS type A sorting domain-containing protein n=1 Tax=Sediminibacter sp. Hel_I_10 TaxID=1392490 RepID=UPI000479AE9A|nr:T9SS type A sorting domain-containing protein [Sediminibacter sp. Hel_I_10]
MKDFFLLIILLPILGFGQIQIGADIDGEAAGDRLGTSVSLSADGLVMAVGGSRNDSNGSNSGHVRVYANTSNTWVQVGDDIDGEATFDVSGIDVSLSSDGSVLAIGAFSNDGNGSNSGHVRIYTNTSGSWIQIGADIDGEAAGDFSGEAVSLSSDGSVVAIGASNNDGNGPNSGHVRVYQNISDSWIQVGADIDGEAAIDLSGDALSLSSDGSVIAIGAPNNDGNGEDSGHVRVYKNISDSWIQIGNDLDGEAAGDKFGQSVSLSSDGSVLAIGGQYNNGNGSVSGHVRAYKNISDNWVQIGADIDGEAMDNQSGSSVSLSSDGSVLAIGASNNDENGTDSGHVRVYQNISGSWTQIGNDIDGEAAGDLSGNTVDLSSDGSILAIGAFFNDGNGTDSGHVRVYNLSSVLTTDSFVHQQFSLYPNPAKDQFTIKIESGIKLKSVSIYNNIGQLLLTSKESNINTSNLVSGLYIVTMETNKGKVSKKLILE